MTPGLMAEIAREIDARRGEQVRSVHQDDPLGFRLDVRGRTTRADLVIHLGAPFPRVHFAPPRPALLTPSPLANTLRALLKGARVDGARATPGERALAIELVRGGETVTLWVELFGGQSNIYVVDAEGCVALTPRGDVAKRRATGKGLPFEAMPERAPRGGEEPTFEGTASAYVAALAASATGARETASAQTRVRRFVKRKLAGSRKAHTQLEAALLREAEADELHRQGELLRGAFHLIKPGMERVIVPDYSRDPPEEVEIELDPGIAPGEQIAHCFKRERKYRRTAVEARKRLGVMAGDVDALEAAALALQDDIDDEALAAVVEGLPEHLRLPATKELDEPAPVRRKEAVRAKPWHAYTSADGWRILVGRDARGNDELTLKQAGPGDLFLHVRGATGSHVIVPTPRGKTVPRDTLLDAAELACHFSERRAAEHNEVDYTPKRYVRKPRGAPAGLVRVERSKTLTLRLDEARRARLLASRARPGSHPETT